MQLRQKFGLLALIYVISLSANFAMSAWCIVVYFESAFLDFQEGTLYEQQLAQARQLLAQQRNLWSETLRRSDRRREYRELEQRLSEILGAIDVSLLAEMDNTLGSRIIQTAKKKNEAVEQWFAGMASAPYASTRPEKHGHVVGEVNARLGDDRLKPDTDATQLPSVVRGGEPKDPSGAQHPARTADVPISDPLPDALAPAFNTLNYLLLEASGNLSMERDANVTAAAKTQERVLMILGANAACGAILCAAGVFFVRRWVMRPIADLREATRQISQGDFAYRIRPRARDELGYLAKEVNQMSATVVDMQTQLVEQERLAAAGEMVTRLAHNIRNPLAGIRGLAEATLGMHSEDEDTVGCQQRIIDTVDRFEKWLRDLQQSVSPLELKPKRVVVQDLLNDVVTALQPMLDRHGVRVEIDVDPSVQEVHVDCLHLEQALVALVTNAVQASTSGQVVRIEAKPDAQGRGRWQLTVSDEGVGIPPDLRQKIFLPYFTTKPEGNGIGLAMATKVVRLHGGQLTVESELGSGSRFCAVMPGLASEV